jgi:hypothetical protein
MPWGRKRLSTSAREALYESARVAGGYPICPRCNLPVLHYQRWHAGHELSPLLGGRVEADQVEHAKCNVLFAAKVEVPLIAKNKRVRQRHIGAHQTRRPMPGGRDSPLKKKMSGEVVSRFAERDCT